MTPKAYAQLWRFHAFVGAVRRSVAVAGLGRLWPTASGFYDQPHVHPARSGRFTGWTPAEYYRRVVEFGPEAASSSRSKTSPIVED